MSWVIGGLLAVLAIALVIAGATGHAAQLFQGVTGKSTAGGSTTSSTTSSQAVDAALASLAQAGTAGAGPGAYAGLSNVSPNFAGQSPQTQAQGGAV